MKLNTGKIFQSLTMYGSVVRLFIIAWRPLIVFLDDQESQAGCYHKRSKNTWTNFELTAQLWCYFLVIQKACWAFMYFFLFILLFKGSRKYQVGMCRCSEIVMFQMDPQAPQSKFFFLVLLECSYLFFHQMTDFSTGNGVGEGIRQTHVCILCCIYYYSFIWI